MTTVQKACYALIISACVMGALLVVNLQSRFTPAANADLVTQRDAISPVMLTAPTMPGQDSLFVLDNNSQKILVYSLDVNMQRLNLVGTIDLMTQLFGNQGGGPRGGGARMPR